jgi:hypothetical protein
MYILLTSRFGDVVNDETMISVYLHIVCLGGYLRAFITVISYFPVKVLMEAHGK